MKKYLLIYEDGPRYEVRTEFERFETEAELDKRVTELRTGNLDFVPEFAGEISKEYTYEPQETVVTWVKKVK